ncbi:MAG: winged helix-turn-helix domain-containing protein [Betaproteobacteria bacterium]
MPTIRVDPDVFEGLQKLAQPFVDTPSAVIRRLLEARGILEARASAPAPRKARTPLVARESGGLTPQPLYERYLLAVLHRQFNGRAHKRDVTLEIVKRMMNDGHIGAADQELVATGETKAENTITWARNALKERGHVSRTSPRGIWELTPRGAEAAKTTQLPRRAAG